MAQMGSIAASSVTLRRSVLLAAVVFLVSLGAVGLLAATFYAGGVPAPIDAAVSIWLHSHAGQPMTDAMLAASFAGAPTTLSIVTALIGATLIVGRRYRHVLFLTILVYGGNFLNYCLKSFVNRARPSFADPILTLPSASFPSGHAMAATVFYGFAVACVVMRHRSDRGRNIARVGGALMIALVCFSRVYLGLHYPSDVLAGVFEAVAWSTLVLTLVPWLVATLRRDTPMGSSG